MESTEQIIGKSPQRFAIVLAALFLSLDCVGVTEPTLRFRSIKTAPDGQLELALSGPSGSAMAVETSTNLVTWTTLNTLTVTNGDLDLSYRIEPQTNQRFYRLSLVTADRDQPPINDSFTNRVSITGTNLVVMGANVNATSDPGGPNITGATDAKTIWWSWTPPVTGIASVSTEGSDFDTVLAVYTGTNLNSLALTAVNDDSGDQPWSQLTFEATAGIRYAIVVDGSFHTGVPASGNAVLRVSLDESPALANYDFSYVDPGFQRPEFKQAVNPARAISDRAGGLLWTFPIPVGNLLDGAEDKRLGNVIRTSELGVPDTNFVTGPLFTETEGTALQSDGKILVGAAKTGERAANGTVLYRVFRLNTNGALDTTFSSPVLAAPPRFITVQGDDRVVVHAATSGFVSNGGLSNVVVRLTATGEIDSSFTPAQVNTPSGISDITTQPVIDSKNRIWIGGAFDKVNGVSRVGLARLEPSGLLDTTFVPSGYTMTGIKGLRSIGFQSDGKVLISAGRFRLTGGSQTEYSLLRLNLDGSLDNSFVLFPRTFSNSSGYNFNYFRRIIVLPDDKILALAGQQFLRFNADGTLDSTFLSARFPEEFLWFEPLSNGGNVVSFPNGAAISPAQFLINGDGSMNADFRANSFQGSTFPFDIVAQPDGKLLIAGPFDRVGLTSRNGNIRLSTNGSIDDTLLNQASLTNLSAIHRLALDSSNRFYASIVLSDTFIPYTFVRFLPGGMIDPDFSPPPLVTDAYADAQFILQKQSPIVWRHSAQDILDAMNANPFAVGKPNIVRLNADGSKDPTFGGWSAQLGATIFEDGTSATTSAPNQFTLGNIGAVILGDFSVLAVLADGRLLLSCTSGPNDVDSSYTYHLIRLKSNGTQEAGFTSVSTTTTNVAPVENAQTVNVQGSSGQVIAISPSGQRPFVSAAPLPDGGALVAGNFAIIDDLPTPSVVKIKADGRIDLSFHAGTGARLAGQPVGSGRVDSITVTPDRKIWITGNFDTFHDIPRGGLVRLNSDGNVDLSYIPPVSRMDYVATNSKFVVSPDGSAYLIGSYRKPEDLWPYGITRLIPKKSSSDTPNSSSQSPPAPHQN